MLDMEMVYEIPTSQMQYDAADKEMDQKNQNWLPENGPKRSMLATR